MRHAKAEDAGRAATDFERTLTDRGRKDAKKMGAWLKKEDMVPGMIVTSPAARAVETALIVCRETGFDPDDLIRDKKIYDASLDELLEVVAAHVGDSERLLLVGHNPGLEELVSYLSRDEPEIDSAGKMMTTAAIAVLDYGGQSIRARRGLARLLCLTRPRD